MSCCRTHIPELEMLMAALGLRDSFDETVRLKATVHFTLAVTLDACSVSWTSDDEDVASIGDDGMVTGLAEGRVTITATFRDVSGSAQVSIQAAVY